MSSINTPRLRLSPGRALLLPLSPARCEDMTVNIDNFTFEPAQLTVKVGTTVTWNNRDDIPHTVVSRGKIQVEGDGYRRQLFVHLHRGRRLHVFLFAAPAHDRDDQG